MTKRAAAAPNAGAGKAAHLEAQLDALREVLRAISASPFDLEGVLGIVVERMSKLCDADIGMIYLPAGAGFFRAVAPYGMNPEHAEYERSHPTPITPGTATLFCFTETFEIPLETVLLLP